VPHFGITEHPTAEWTGQQMVEAFWKGESKTYVIRDRDKIYGEEFRTGERQSKRVMTMFHQSSIG